MHYYYITGTSRGIGNALAEAILERGDTYVVGLSRTKKIAHERYEHIVVDLNELEVVKNFQFISLPDADSVTLVNNSGMLGDVNHVGKIDPNSIIETFNVNIVSPSILMNNFVAAYQNYEVPCTVLNVSSGAGRHTIESWGSYCATKAAMDMFSEVASYEQKMFFKQQGVNVFAVAPGIVDTQMQVEIRDLDKVNFSELDRFVGYKKDGALSDPKNVAEQLLKICDSPCDYKDVLLDVRKL